MLICLVGDPDDLSGAYLRWRAEQRGIDVLTLAENTLGESWTLRIERDGCGRIEYADRSVPFEQIGGAIVRLNPKPTLPEGVEFSDAEAGVFIIERRQSLHWFLDNAPFAVCNRPRAGRANASKPYQMGLLAAAGFTVPRWTVTNRTDVVAQFLEDSPRGAIYKSCSGLRSHVRRVEGALGEELAAETVPVLVQDYIPGTDVRVHVVDRQVFAVEVTSEAIDYRFDASDTRYDVVDVPDGLVQQCLDFAADQELLLAGFDFRKTLGGDWLCLEVNPVPTFIPYEAATGLPIGDAVLNLFIRS